MEQSKDLQNLIKTLSQFPGLGPRSAKRMVLYMLERKDVLMRPLGKAIDATADAITRCDTCYNLDTINPCHICSDERRDKTQLCIVQSVQDLWALERTRMIKGQYHILGGLLSALDGVKPQDLRIGQMIDRIRTQDVQEVIIALSATVDGQSTAHYIHEQLRPLNHITVSKLAHGVPVGGQLDYLDDGTLTLALKSRSKLE